MSFRPGGAAEAPEQQPTSQRRDLLLALLLGVGTLVITVIATLPSLLSYSPRGDDTALLLHSSRFGSPRVSDWFTEGFREYNINYPELGDGDTNFLRPGVNASVYLDSLLSAHDSSPLMLTTSYVGHALAVVMVFVLGRRLLRLSAPASFAAAVLAASTVSAVSVLRDGVAYRGDMLGAVLTLGAVLAVCGKSRLRLVAGSLLTLAAMFTKESAAIAPVVVALVLLCWQHDGPPRLTRRAFSAVRVRTAGFVAGLPLLIYAIVRLRHGLGGTYIQEDLPSRIFGVPMLALNPFRFLGTAFFTVEAEALKDLVTARAPAELEGTLRLGRAPLALLASAIAWLVVAVAWRRGRANLGPALAIALASAAVPLVIKADPRFMYLSQAMFALVLMAAAFGAARSWSPLVRAAAVAALVVIGPAYFVLSLALSNARIVADNEDAQDLMAALQSHMADPTIARVYLLNAPGFASPGLPFLQYAARRAGRTDVTLRVVSTLADWDRAATSPDEGLAVEERPGEVMLAVTVGEDEPLFPYTDEATYRRLGVRGLITYGPARRFERTRWGRESVADRTLRFTLPRSRSPMVVVGIDPARDGLYVLRIEGAVTAGARSG